MGIYPEWDARPIGTHMNTISVHIGAGEYITNSHTGRFLGSGRKPTQTQGEHTEKLHIDNNLNSGPNRGPWDRGSNATHCTFMKINNTQMIGNTISF